MDPKQCTIWTSLGHECFSLYGRYSVEVQVQSLFQDQTVSGIKIVNDIGEFVREAMPIHKAEKASEKTAAKTRPIQKLSSISCWGFVLIGQRKSIDIF